MPAPTPGHGWAAQRRWWQDGRPKWRSKRWPTCKPHELLRAFLALYIAFVSKSVGAGYPGAKGIVAMAVLLTLASLWEFGRPVRKA